MDHHYFGTRYSPDPNRSRVWKAICEYLQDYVPSQGTVLDIGAGYCDFINQIRAARKYAVDANPEVARYCAPEVQFLQVASAELLDLPDGSIDVVMASNLLEHLSEAQCAALLDRLEKLLKQRGRIILIQPNYYYCYRQYWDDYTHVRAFSHVSLGDLLVSRGYTLLRVEKKFLPFSFKSLLPKSYLITKLYLASFWRPMAKQMLLVAER